MQRSFQKVPPGYEPFTLAQRFGAIVRNGGKLLAVGTVASLVGVGLTDGIVMARQVSHCRRPCKQGATLAGSIPVDMIIVVLCSTSNKLRLPGMQQALYPDFVPLNPPQNIAVTAVLYGLYMSVSSNLRCVHSSSTGLGSLLCLHQILCTECSELAL